MVYPGLFSAFFLQNSQRPFPVAFCLLPSAFCLLPSAFCLLPVAISDSKADFSG